MKEIKGILLNMSNKVKCIIIGFSVIFVVYVGFSIYFSNHFYFGTKINDINVSGKTVEATDEMISTKIEAYTLELEERGNINEIIKASDTGLKYNTNGETQSFIEAQNSYIWFVDIFKNKNLNLSDMITYDDEKLKTHLNTLSCLVEKNVVEPKNPTFQFSENKYSIVDEVYGNKVNKDALYEKVSAAINNMDNTINLEEKDCYEKPKYTKKSAEVLAAKDALDKYANTKITYKFGSVKEVLDGQLIKDLLDISDNYVVTLNEEKVKKYVGTLASKYDTLDKTRDFKTSTGNKVKVEGGDYGWLINKSAEVKDLIAQIKNGQPIEKEPKYKQTAFHRSTNDIGNTYVEINLSKQHLWFYKNGSLVVEGDVVTGNVSGNTATPPGTYSLKYKEENATLRGADYSVPVSFWMPFNDGIGIHDASWRGEFGGSIYLSGGSHGCINSPYFLANTIYNNIEAGTPIICYYD